MFQRFILLWLVLLGLLAFGWAGCLPGLPDPFLATAPGLNWLFAVTMLAIGSLLPRDEIRQVVRRWPTVLGGTAVQYSAMPLLAWLLGRLLGLEGPALAGVLLAGCVPGAMASNVLTLMARGNVSYSVSLTTSATLLSPVAVPLALWLALGRGSQGFPALQLIWQLCWMVVGPVVAGHLLARCWKAWANLAERAGAVVANLSILWIIAVTVAKNRENLAHLDGRLLVALTGLNLGGYLAGLAAGRLMRLPPGMRRALTLEIGMQNAGLGAVLAAQLFGSAAAIAPAIYTFGCMFTGTILARLWAAQTIERPTRPAPQAASPASAGCRPGGPLADR
jgi:BASS family bile acid:Na+ symporter